MRHEKYLLIAWAIAALFAAPALAKACSDDPNETIERLIVRITAEGEQSSKIAAAEELSIEVSKFSPDQKSEVKDESVDKMAALLEGQSEAVKVTIAEALGQLGGRAAKAIPALERASKAPEQPASGIIMSSVPTSFFMKKAIDDINAGIAEDRRRRNPRE